MYINARQFGNGPRCLADISKCRFSALYENVYPIPVYSPQDTIEPFRGELADYMWVDKGVPTSDSELFVCLPYQGPRFYFKPLVEFMLDRKIISTKHIMWCLQATTHLPPDFFRAPFDELRRLWQLAAPERGEKAAKEGLNAMFGVWGIYEAAKYKTLTTNRPEDAQPYGDWFARYRNPPAIKPGTAAGLHGLH